MQTILSARARCRPTFPKMPVEGLFSSHLLAVELSSYGRYLSVVLLKSTNQIEKSLEFNEDKRSN